MTTPIDPIREALLAPIMEQAQVFASAWSLVGGRFDFGDGMATAEEAKADLQQMLEAALNAKDAEIETLRADADEDAHVIDRLSKLLAGVAIALKGDELPLHRHSYHDLADVADATKLELDLYRAAFPNGIPAATLDATLKEPS